MSVLQCAGNGRAFFAAKQKVGGGQWHNGGMGNVEWEGVPLRPFLDSLKMVPAQGRDLADRRRLGPAGDAGRHRLRQELQLDDPALDHAILALKMNGEPIPAPMAARCG